MIKALGSRGIGYLFCLYGTLYAQQEKVTLHLTDMHGAPIVQIEAGTPFTIKACAHGLSAAHKDLTLEGLKSVIIEGHEAHMQIINGDRTIAHVYRARIDLPGTYQLGPAAAESKGTRYESQNVVLVVTKTSRTAHERASMAKKESVFARLSLDRSTVYVGETLRCSVRFYARDADDAQVTNIVVPAHSIMQPHQYQGPIEGTEKIQGATYRYSEWQWVCCPKTAGEIVIPSFSIVYTVPLNELSGFSAFFGVRLKQYVVYTNAVTITVKNLPPHDKPVQAIGSYRHFTAHCTPTTADVGQGVVLSLTLEGSGDRDAVTNPELTSLPCSLNYYDSQATVDADPKTAKKTFEYIIQGTQPGTFELPEQSFTFFDPELESYKTLKTAPITLTITGALPPTDLMQELPPESVGPSITELYPVLDSFSSGSASCWSIPAWLLWILMVLPPLGALMVGMRRIIMAQYTKKRGIHMHKKSFAHARFRVHQAEKIQAYQQLYAIFVDLCAVRLGACHERLSDDRVCQELARAGFSDEQISQWQHFFGRCAAFVFSAHHAQPDPSLFTQARFWIDLWESFV